MTDEKYITFKREEFQEMIDDYKIVGSSKENVNKWARDHALRDSVVIRLKDEFAAAALHTYANSISVAARAIGMHAPTTSKRLSEIADYFHTQAVKSDDLAEHKLPD